jgi:hypothetical protein
LSKKWVLGVRLTGPAPRDQNLSDADLITSRPPREPARIISD